MTELLTGQLETIAPDPKLSRRANRRAAYMFAAHNITGRPVNATERMAARLEELARPIVYRPSRGPKTPASRRASRLVKALNACTFSDHNLTTCITCNPRHPYSTPDADGQSAEKQASTWFARSAAL